MATQPVLDADPIGGQDDWEVEDRHKDNPIPNKDNSEKTSKNYKILLKFPIPKVDNITINQLADVRAVLSVLFDQHPDIKITDTTGKFQISNMKEFPRSVKAFERFFECETVVFPKPTKTIKGNYSTQFHIESLMSLSAIKNAVVFKFLTEKNIFLTSHELSTNQSACMAIIIKKHTKITNITALTTNLRTAIHHHLTHYTDDDLPDDLTVNLASQLYLRTETIKHRLPAPTPENPNFHKIIEATVFCVYTNRDKAAALGNYIANEDIFVEEVFGEWIPYTARFDKDYFANKLREHNAFQSTVKYHVIEGVSNDMMEMQYIDPATGEKCDSCYEAIYSSGFESTMDDNCFPLDEPIFTRFCEAPEVTSTTDTTGRWFIPYCAPEASRDALNLIQDMISYWNEGPPMSPDNLPRIVPRRGRHTYEYADRQPDQFSYGRDNDQFNRGKPQRNRPPRTVQIDNNLDIDTPTWASIVSPPTQTKQPNPTQVHNNPTSNSSVKSATTVSTSNRTGYESLLSQIQIDMRKALDAQQESINSIVEENAKRREDILALVEVTTNIQQFMAQTAIENQARDESMRIQMQEMQAKMQLELTQSLTASFTQMLNNTMATIFEHAATQNTPSSPATQLTFQTPPRISIQSDTRPKRPKPSTPPRPPPLPPAPPAPPRHNPTSLIMDDVIMSEDSQNTDKSPAPQKGDGAQSE